MSDTPREPVLWLVENSHGVVVDLFDNAANAQREANRLNIERLRSDYHAVPLCRDPPPPTLTDAEVAFLKLHRQRLVWWAHSSKESAAELETVNGLLARHGGAGFATDHDAAPARRG